MRYGALVWVGDEVVGVRTGAEAAPAIVLPAPTVAAGVAWWTDPGGPALIAALVADLTHDFVGDELVELVLLVPAEARPELEAALGFAVPDVDVRVVPVHEAVTALLGAATRVGEWRDGELLWSGDGDRAVAVGPRELAGSVELRMATEAPDADFLSAERLVQRYAATLEPPLDDQPVAVDDDVQFTVYRPRAARPEHTERLVAFAHKSEEYEEDGKLVDPAAEVARLAEEVLGDLSGQVTTTQDADAPIARGDVLRFVPVVPGVHFNPVALEFQWLRGVHREVFEFVAGRELDGQTVTGRLSVYVGLRLVADVTLRIRVDSTAADAVQERSHGRVYGKVFPSYSHQDAVVVAQITAAAETLGHEYLRDVDRLRAGQEWQRELERFIEQADVFQLFWSPASMMSPHVHHEWDYALSLNRPDFVRPVYWQEPRPTAPPDLPPPELDRLHFAYLGGLARVAPVTAPVAPVTAPSAPVTAPAVAPPGPPRSSRRGVRAAVAGIGTAAIAAVAVTAALASGGAPSASPPSEATASASATHEGAGEPAPAQPPPATTMSASPISPPSSEAARAVVMEFFTALDDGDVDAAADLVCADYLDELGGDLERLATYSYEPPVFESEEEQGSRRELVVSMTYSDSAETYSERLRISVSGGFDTLICGIAPA